MFLAKTPKMKSLKAPILGHRQKQDLAFFDFSLYQGNPFYPLKASFSILTLSRIFLGLPQNTTFLLSLGFLSNPLFSRSWDAKRPHRGFIFPLQGLDFFLLILLSLGYSFLPLEDNWECLFIAVTAVSNVSAGLPVLSCIAPSTVAVSVAFMLTVASTPL